MKWDEIRVRFPHQWLLVEAISAHSDTGKRIIDQLEVIDGFPDSTQALRGYTKLHHDLPERELYVFHTSRDHLDVAERQWLGVRTAG